MRGYAKLYQARRPQFTPGTSRGLICVQLKSQPFPSFALFGTTGSRRLAPFSLAPTTPATQPSQPPSKKVGYDRHFLRFMPQARDLTFAFLFFSLASSFLSFSTYYWQEL